MSRTVSRTITACLVAAALAVVAPGCKSKVKGGGAKSASAAKSSSQKTGSAAKGATQSATPTGSDSGGVTCDSSLEGVGFCSSDSSVVFCSGGSWYELDCNDVAEGAFCFEDGDTIDCFTDG
jgi:hypothetical protein